MTFIKIPVILLFPLILGCGEQEIGKAQVGEKFSNSVSPFEQIILSKEYINVSANYSWSICNKNLADNEGLGRYIDLLHRYTESVVKSNIRLGAIEVYEKDKLVSKNMVSKIQNNISSEVRGNGICVESLSITADNKSLKDVGALKRAP